MKIDLHKNTKEIVELSNDEIKDLVTSSLSLFGLTDNLEIEIMFVDQAKIQKLNSKYRNICKPTDVLSFPQDQYNHLKSTILGSIVICQTISKERNESLEQVIKHGLLHLLGYDHEKNEIEWNEAAVKINCTL